MFCRSFSNGMSNSCRYNPVCWQSLSDDNGARPPRPGDYFTKGNLIRGGVEGAVIGGVLWSLALWWGW